jgi:hypothetical protein
VFVSGAAVGAVGFPVRAGDARVAYAWFFTNAVVAICVVLSDVDAVGAVGVPVRAGDASGAFNAKLLVIVAAKFGSLPKAAAISFRVSSVAGDDAIKLAMAVRTNAVVATLVEFSVSARVGVVMGPVTSRFPVRAVFPVTSRSPVRVDCPATSSPFLTLNRLLNSVMSSHFISMS